MQLTTDHYSTLYEYPTHWGDMDSARHINNLVYLRWSETARVAFFEESGVAITFNQGIGPILAWHDCKYVFPLTHPDTVRVGVRVLELMEDRFIIETGIFSKRHNRIAAISKQVIVPYDYQTLQKTPLPPEWLEGIKALNAGT